MRPSFSYLRLSGVSFLLLLLLLMGGAVEAVRAAAPPWRWPAEKRRERDGYSRETARLERAGKLPEAIAAAKKMLAVERQVLGNVHVDVAGSLTWLGRMHEQRGDFAAAVHARREELTCREQVHGKQHWKTTDARLALAHSERLAGMSAEQRRRLGEAGRWASQMSQLHRQGKNAEALTLARKTAELRKELLGEKDRDYANSLQWLAFLHARLKDPARALDFYQQTLKVRKEVLGERHPDYATSLYNVAMLYHNMGDHRQALPLYQQVLKLRKDLLGEKHPDYLISLANLAVSLDKVGAWYEQREDFAAATQCRREAVAVREQLHGKGHWRVTDARLALAHSERLAGMSAEQRRQLSEAGRWNCEVVQLHRQGKYVEALALAGKAAAVRKELLGEHHPDYTTSLNNLATIYNAMGDHKRALPLFHQAIKLCKEMLGERHPDYATSLNNLATLHLAMRDYKQALPLYQEALKLRKEVLGERHSDYANSLNNMATLYNAMGNPRQALPFCQQALKLNKEVLGEKHPAYLISLANLAMLYYAMGDHRQALPLFQQVLKLRKEVLGEKHPAYLVTLANLAVLLDKVGAWDEQRENFAAAVQHRRQALAVREQLHGKQHWRTTDARLALAHSELLAGMKAEQRKRLSEVERQRSQMIQLDHQGRNGEALTLACKTAEFYKEVLGERHPDCAASLNNLAFFYDKMGDHKHALPLYQEALKLRKEVLGERHPDYTSTLNNLGMVYKAMGHYKQALPLLQQALKLRKEVLGERHPDYATSLENLATLHFAMGEYQQALPLYHQALKLYKEVQGERHPYYTTSLNNLAMLYRDMGDYKQALPLFQQALKLRKEVLGERNPAYATSLENLATLYYAMGDNKQALPLYLQAMKLRKEVLGERHPFYAISLNNLALLYQAMGDHKQALPLYQQALKLYKEVQGERHPDYTSTLNNLAMLYRDMGDNKQALPLFQQALKIEKEVLGERHPAYATSLNNLALLHQDMGEHRQALPLYQQALKIAKEVLGERHPYYATSLINLASLHQALQDGEQARSFSDQSLAITRANLLLAASVQSERQQLSATRAVRVYLDVRLSLPDPVAEGATASYRHALAWKGAVFARQQQRHLFTRLLAADSRSEVRPLVDQLQQATRLLAVAALAPTDRAKATARREQLEKLTQEKEDLEARLSRLSGEYRASQNRIEITPQALRQALPEGVALVDFLFYTHNDPTQKDRTKRLQRRLTAFVVRKDRPVVRLDLGPAEAVEQAITSWRQTVGKKQRGEEDAGQTLRKLLWLPLQKHVADAKVVLLSPDGALAKLPFAALPGSKEGTYLLEEIALAVVPVPQLLPELLAPMPKEKRSKPSLLVVGDVDFDKAAVMVAKAGDRSAPRGSLKGWGKLDATAAEVAAIRETFTDRFEDGKVTSLRKRKATKAAVCEALRKSRFAHLATHGFFAPPELKSALGSADRNEQLFGKEGVSGWHPLLLSGVVLSGANREAKPGEDDGILTALEVSEMDLSGCELVALSACETGLGKVAGGEGVLGLQRAFQVAGTGSVVASLWKVDDGATRDLMVGFYKHLWDEEKPLSRIEALRQAQLSMLREGYKRGMVRRKEEDKGERVPPLYWAAFVLSGDWR